MSPWQGTWTDDNYKGFLYLCVNGNLIQGAFSNIGWVNGIISADGLTVNGTWGYAGYGIGQAGNFQWQLLAGNASFSGSLWAIETPCKTSPWSPGGVTNRINPIVTNAQCQLTSGAGSMSGRWANADNSLVIDICSDGTFFQASYTVNNANGTTILGKSGSGFSWGLAYTNDQYAQASYVDPVYYGIEYYELLATGQLLNGYYPNFTTPFTSIDYNLNYNYAVLLTQVNGQSGNSSACLNNQALVGPVWSGVWSDSDFGYGSMYLCTDGTNIWGVYSQVGYVLGFINASNPLNIYGQFYDAGDATVGTGNFTLTMAANGQSFTGTWNFANDTTLYAWDEYRQSPEQPTVFECLTQNFTPDENTTLSGQWYYVLQDSENVTLDICFNLLTERYELSYSSTQGNIQGYGLGYIDVGGIRGEWYTATAQGIEFYRLFNDTEMADFYWPFDNLQAVQYLPCDGLVSNNWFLQHGQYIYNRVSYTTTESACNRNSALVVGVPNPPFISPSPTPTNTASAFPSRSPISAAAKPMISAAVLLLLALVAILI